MELPAGVRVASWIPQRALISHPHCKLLVSHGGANSISEACEAAVPIVGVPIGFDQPANVAMLEELGVGRAVDLTTCSAKVLANAMREVLDDARFAERATALACAMRQVDIGADGAARLIEGVCGQIWEGTSLRLESGPLAIHSERRALEKCHPAAGGRGTRIPGPRGPEACAPEAYASEACVPGTCAPEALRPVVPDQQASDPHSCCSQRRTNRLHAQLQTRRACATSQGWRDHLLLTHVEHEALRKGILASTHPCCVPNTELFAVPVDEARLQLCPYPGLRLLRASPPVYLVDGFLTDNECDAAIASALPRLERSVVGSGQGDRMHSARRTSFSCTCDGKDGWARALLQRACRLTGKQEDNMEEVQIARYTIGQECLRAACSNLLLATVPKL